MNLTGQNNLIYALDSLSSSSWGVAVCKNTGFDFRNASAVKGLTVTANQPSGCEIYFAFSDGGNWFRLSTTGTAESISSSTPSFETLKSSGNTPSQLRALTNIPAFAGKLILAAIGLSSADPENAKPSVKLSASCSVSSQTTSYTEYSPVYALGEKSVISDVLFDKLESSGGTVTVTGKIFSSDGSESEWLTPEQMKGTPAESVQLRCVYYSPSPGSSSASLSRLDVKYFTGSSGAPMTEGRIYSVTEDWYMNIKAARLSIKHSALDQTTMKVYAAFRKSPGHAVKENLGIASGTRKTFQLSHTGGIRYDTFRLYSDNQEITSYELNGESARVTLTAPEGSVIYASYDYGWDKEIWREMALSERVSLADYDMSEYRIEIADGGYSAAAFMIETKCASGWVQSEIIGTGTGRMQTLKLSHRASNVPHVEYGNINANEAVLSKKNYTLLDDPRFMRVAAPAGKVIRCQYNWQSEPVRIMQVSAVFSE